jgi:hypothetical protein
MPVLSTADSSRGNQLLYGASRVNDAFAGNADMCQLWPKGGVRRPRCRDSHDRRSKFKLTHYPRLRVSWVAAPVCLDHRGRLSRRNRKSISRGSPTSLSSPRRRTLNRPRRSLTARRESNIAARPAAIRPSSTSRTSSTASAGVDLTRIDGIDVGVAQTVISEVGFDMTRWKTAAP